jgi:hypothetical protein
VTHPLDRKIMSRAFSIIVIAIIPGVFALAILFSHPIYQTFAMNIVPNRTTVHGSMVLTTTTPTYFEVGFTGITETVTIMLTDTARIEEARDIANGVETDAIHVMGNLIKTKAPYNPDWSYHLAPSTITFFANAIEVCDANPVYVEEHLEDVCGAFLPQCVWCPWTSRVIEEIELSSVYLPYFCQ